MVELVAGPIHWRRQPLVGAGPVEFRSADPPWGIPQGGLYARPKGLLFLLVSGYPDMFEIPDTFSA